MRPFRYLRDPLFLTSLALYWLNRLVIEPWRPGGFFQHHLNDLLCIPFWVPILVWLQRRLGLRAHDEPPRTMEIVLPLLLWAWLFEVALPQQAGRHHTADPADVVAYAAGALVAAIAWRLTYAPEDPGERR